MASLFNNSLIEKDLASVWHPFTQMLGALPILITKGKGAYLYGEEGTLYLDAISSWWVNLHGHAHPYIAEKIASQAELLEHVLFAGFTHPPAIELADRLLSLLPGKMSKIFYSDNGSTAVEIAIKMALQYWYNQDPQTKKRKVICFKHSYHGETFGAMSVAGKSEFHRPFWNHLFEAESIEAPLLGKEEECFLHMERLLSHKDVACFIFEPLVLGAGGMIVYPAEPLDRLIRLCRESQVLTIADEVMTGFGRLGPLFACQFLRETPDLIALSKGLTGGFLPLGVTACKEGIFNAFLGKNLSQAFLHGHSYTANPLACTSALASLDLLLDPACASKREKIAASHASFCDRWKGHPKLRRCESLGTLLIIEYSSEKSSYFQPMRERLYSFFLKHHILVRPLGNVLYLLPPYCIEEEELQFIYDQIVKTLECEGIERIE